MWLSNVLHTELVFSSAVCNHSTFWQNGHKLHFFEISPFLVITVLADQPAVERENTFLSSYCFPPIIPSIIGVFHLLYLVYLLVFLCLVTCVIPSFLFYLG